MRLDDLTGGRVYIDTNVLYMYLRADTAHLLTIRSFLERVIQGEIEAFVGVPVLDELAYRLLLARVKEKSGRNPLEVLRENLAGAIQDHSDLISSAIRQFMSLPHISVVGVEASDGDLMFDNMTLHKLLPRDALHMAIMQRLGIGMIASDDADFDRIAGLQRFWVVNPPARTVILD
jgi:predicted nucleic acid-binding protein